MTELADGTGYLRDVFKAVGTLLKFQPGQLLSDDKYIPAKVYFIETGSARLLGHHGNRLIPVDRLGPGALVGAISMIRRHPCEHIRAAEDLTVFSLEDKKFRDLLASDKRFESILLESLYPAEILDLLGRKSEQNPLSRDDLIASYQRSLKQARVLLLPEKSQSDIGHSKGGSFYMSASLVGEPLQLDPGEEIDIANLVYSGTTQHSQYRVLYCPDSVFPKKYQSAIDESAAVEIACAPARPAISQYNQSPSDVLPQLVVAKGEVKEAMACFQMLSTIFNLPYRKDAIEKILLQYSSRGQAISIRLYAQIASGLGLHVTSSSVAIEDLDRLDTPSLLIWKESVSILIRNDQRGLVLASPRYGRLDLTVNDFHSNNEESIQVVHLDKRSTTPEAKFGLPWFLPALKRHKKVLVQVLVATFVIQLFTLANPLLIQVIIDKVITQRSLDTLQVLGIALVVVTIFEGVLGSLKTFLFTETTNRIDQRLGAEVIDHLLRLPLSYFDRRPVGELGSRISELEKIRRFLTGQALTTFIDAIFSVVYIAVMVIYSFVLTAVALSVLPVQIGLTLLGAPIFRRQYRDSAEANAETQSHLVEVLTGIQTVKSQNVELMSRSTWQDRYAKYISKTFAQTITGTGLNQASQVLQKLSQLLVLWVGAGLVLNGSLTLGQLIAFRIISGYVTQPLLRLSSIWQSIQELRVSFERLADVINTPQESNETDQGKVPLPSIQGEVVFQDVTFSFSANSEPVLKNINLEIPQGTFVGVVGQSGSGKSTLMKLLPRLYLPDSGHILIDGFDILKVELYSIRRQIGIVPQDPLLFSGSIADNIALTNPDVSNEDIVASAKLACAHDFIMNLPDGYSTKIGERGSSLSGGQRQRIAVARTLLANPRLLIMDEATSALDYETERSLCDNLISGIRDKTVFFVTHRLSTVRRADLIIVMHQGLISELGTHDQLMNLKGRYFALYRQQEVL